MDINICPPLEGDRIPLYMSFNLSQWDEWFRKVKFAEITTGGNNNHLLVVSRLGILARAMKTSEDLHDVI
jgi:hypothetical protein